LNKVFRLFIKWWSKAISSFDVQRSMFDVQKILHSAPIEYIYKNPAEYPALWAEMNAEQG